MDFAENALICLTILTILILGVLAFHGLGLIIMRLRDIRTGKKRFYFLRRVL